ncbi:unnamed protein product [Acanthoscelides obtectus]|uniref:Uncharacterized protein n=1 Tax=Acanthoscelides obtectus TaxID=200917 RepID=A0A9P0L320_ACAOB|nr:unnamed protein product [Acanthoscelides obtectus]CAK1678019.1 hypothetical protein AOBTE_LOCUS31718 [Acanthoscelides obtectus]
MVGKRDAVAAAPPLPSGSLAAAAAAAAALFVAAVSNELTLKKWSPRTPPHKLITSCMSKKHPKIASHRLNRVALYGLEPAVTERQTIEGLLAPAVARGWLEANIH